MRSSNSALGFRAKKDKNLNNNNNIKKKDVIKNNINDLKENFVQINENNDQNIKNSKTKCHKLLTISEQEFLDSFKNSDINDFAKKNSLSISRIINFLLIIILFSASIFLSFKVKSLSSKLKSSNEYLRENQNDSNKLEILTMENQELKKKLNLESDGEYIDVEIYDNGDDITELNKNKSVTEYIVKPGDTIIGICKEFYDNLNYNKIIKDNNLSSDNIKIGQKILIYD